MTSIPSQQIPALQPPEGVMPDFDHPHSSARVVQVTVAIALPLMLLVILLRIYVRARVKKTWACEDTSCILAVFSTIAQCAILLSLLNDPLGPHQWNIRLVDLTPGISKKSICSTVTYSIAAFCTKLSLFLLYFHIFGPNRRARLFIHIGIIFTAVSSGISIIGFCALCIPRKDDKDGWRSIAVTKRCTTPVVNLQMFSGVVNVLTDFYVLAIPIPVLWQMNLPLSKRIRIGAIFATGLLVCICSVWTLVYRVKFLSDQDLTWHSIPLYALSTAELNIGIMCACFPVLTPIFQFESSRQRFASIVSYFRSLTGGLNLKSSSSRYRDSNKDKRWYPLVRIRKSKRQAYLESDDVEKPKSKAFPQENDQSWGKCNSYSGRA